MKPKPVSGPRKEKRRRPAAERAMPAEAMSRGSVRSESRPAKGEARAMTMGWATRTSPAFWGGRPLMYWR